MATDNDNRQVDEATAQSNQNTGWQKQHDDEQGGGGGSAGGGGQTKHAAGETTPPDRDERTGSRADDGSRRESAA